MPQTPSANPQQRQVLEDLTSLAQDDAVSTGNQVALLDSQIEKFNAALALFQERYAFWDNYIKAYEAERKLMNGVFTLNPIVQTDYQDFMNTRGRLYVSGSFRPNRIAQFDNVGFSPTGTEAENELNILTEEAQYRNYLQNNFQNQNPLPPVPGGGTYELSAPFSPGSKELRVNTSNGNSVTFPTGPGQLLVYSPSSPTAGVIVEYLVCTPGPELLAPGTATFSGLKYTSDFTTISLNSPVSNTGPNFTDSERSSGIANSSANQSRLHAYIRAYAAQVQRWQSLVNQQVNQFVTEQNAGEDEPDSNYIGTVQNLLADLNAFLASLDASDVGLALLQQYNEDRTSHIPGRIQYIDDRLIEQTRAYDGRYRYADRLYNLADGAFVLIDKITKQKNQLIVRQAEANYRAAELSQEIF